MLCSHTNYFFTQKQAWIRDTGPIYCLIYPSPSPFVSPALATDSPGPTYLRPHQAFSTSLINQPPSTASAPSSPNPQARPSGPHPSPSTSPPGSPRQTTTTPRSPKSHRHRCPRRTRRADRSRSAASPGSRAGSRERGSNRAEARRARIPWAVSDTCRPPGRGLTLGDGLAPGVELLLSFGSR